MYGGMGVSAPSLHRESTDSLIATILMLCTFEKETPEVQCHFTVTSCIVLMRKFTVYTRYVLYIHVRSQSELLRAWQWWEGYQRVGRLSM